VTGDGLLARIDYLAVWGMDAAAEAVPIDFTLRRRGHDRRRLIAYLRGVIPADLVQDLSIDGRSWADAGE
jgi:hypothetical protein